MPLLRESVDTSIVMSPVAQLFGAFVAAAQLAATGALAGRAVFEGQPPPPPELIMSADPACVQRAGLAVKSDAVLVDATGGLQNVFVYISSGLDPRATFDVPAEPVVLDQVRCGYVPRVAGIRIGQPLQIVNSDPLLHNAHARPIANRPFNIGQPIQGMRSTQMFTTPEVMVSIGSDIHPWMAAFIGVMAHPFFAATGADGAFAINGIPPGDYTVEAWHERFGTTSRQVRIGAGATTRVTFAFQNR
jgi:Carboxypeptidase regulatory-like domain